MDIVDFVTENYIWFIVVGIIILMAIVGYIADKTDFGRNRVERQPKEKQEKVKPEKVVKEKIKKEKNKKEKNLKEEVVEELPAMEQNVVETVNNIESAEQPIYNEIPQDFSTENNFINDNVKDTLVTDETQVDQSLFEPLPSIDQFFNEQPVEQNNNIEVSSEPININLENEEVKQNSEVESDDDIWKF